LGCSKTEAVGRASPFRIGPLRTIDEVECATMEWVDWYNNRRHNQLNYIPPDEHEAAHYAQT
jgi:transposase InsO family protein